MVGVDTFDALSKAAEVVTVQGLSRMIQMLGMDKQQPMKVLRENMAALAKEINLIRKDQEGPVRSADLNYDGFQEFMLQISHQFFNSLKDPDSGVQEFTLKSHQLQESFFGLLSEARKQLHLPTKYFEGKTDDEYKNEKFEDGKEVKQFDITLMRYEENRAKQLEEKAQQKEDERVKLE